MGKNCAAKLLVSLNLAYYQCNIGRGTRAKFFAPPTERESGAGGDQYRRAPESRSVPRGQKALLIAVPGRVDPSVAEILNHGGIRG
jgi:hypothetical protein